MVRRLVYTSALCIPALVACGNSVTATPDAAVAIDATPTFTVSVGIAGGGGGTVTSAPAGIDCGADCAETVVAGTSVTLTATAAAGSTFAGWAGGSCTGTTSCTVTVDADVSVTAMMVPNHTLVVIPAGTGSGAVTSSPAGIDCGADCTEAFAPGTPVTLTATPAGSSIFLGWSGACSGTSTCAVTADGAQGVVATFGVPQATLTVLKAGTGTGTVSSAEPAIDCGPDCTETAAVGSMITLSATPSAGAMFTGWSGGGCTGTGTCVVTLDAATEVTATFTLTPYGLTVTRVGSGTVTSSPSGIDCGGDCTEEFGAGTLVTLVQSPAAGSTFTGWSGACTGTGVCAVSIDAAASVTANFATTPPKQVCDLFIAPNGTTVPGWTERVADWSVEGGRIRQAQDGGVYTNVITKDGSSFTDGCVSFTAYHSGVAGDTQAVGAVLRWSAPNTYVVALVQENASAAGYNSIWIYQYPGGSSLGGTQTNLNLGASPRVEVCATGPTITLRADTNQDGTWDNTSTATTTVTGAGLAGVMTHAFSTTNVTRVDDVCWTAQ